MQSQINYILVLTGIHVISVYCIDLNSQNVYPNQRLIKSKFASSTKTARYSNFKENSNIENENSGLQATLTPLYQISHKRKRSAADILSVAQELATNLGGMAMELANQGVAVKDGHTSGINVLGQKFEAGYDAKLGYGDAMNPETNDENNREKRSPCSHRRTTAAPGNGGNEGDNGNGGGEEPADPATDGEEARRGRNGRRRSRNRSRNIKNEENNANKRRKREVSTETDKEIEQKDEMIQKVSEAVKQMWQNVTNMFHKIGQHFQHTNNEVNATQPM